METVVILAALLALCYALLRLDTRDGGLSHVPIGE